MTEFRVFKLLDLYQAEQQMKKYGNIPSRIDIYFTHINALTKYGLKMRDCTQMQDKFKSQLLEVKRLNKKNKWKKIVQKQTENIGIEKNHNISQCMDKIMHILVNQNQKKLAALILDIQNNRESYKAVVVTKQQNKIQSANTIQEECLLKIPFNNNKTYLSFSAEQFKEKDLPNIVQNWEQQYKIEKKLILENAKTEQVFVGSYPEFIKQFLMIMP